jgi:hypothetical protein
MLARYDALARTGVSVVGHPFDFKSASPLAVVRVRMELPRESPVAYYSGVRLGSSCQNRADPRAQINFDLATLAQRMARTTCPRKSFVVGGASLAA